MPSVIGPMDLMAISPCCDSLLLTCPFVCKVSLCYAGSQDTVGKKVRLRKCVNPSQEQWEGSNAINLPPWHIVLLDGKHHVAGSVSVPASGRSDTFSSCNSYERESMLLGSILAIFVQALGAW